MNQNEMIFIGVAGNFAGHLDQAGEGNGFAHATEVDDAPKALFPIYVPNLGDSRLNVFPVTNDTIHHHNAEGVLQIEPEIALACDLVYEGNTVRSVVPRKFAAFNDCSIRREGPGKLSEKKNWGPASKGLADEWMPLEGFAPGDELDHYRIASFLRRDGVCYEYGVDSRAVEYSYFHGKLLDWVVEKMNHQQDEGAAEDISALLAAAGYPKQAVICIGATGYTPFGSENFLQLGDESIVVVYDARLYNEEDVRHMAQTGDFASDGMSVVSQQVVSA